MKKSYKHLEVVKFKHKITKGNMNFLDTIKVTEIECNGIVTWDEGIEGLICNKCQLYTGVK